MGMARFKKYATVLAKPAYYGALRHKVVPGIEHSAAITLARPASLLDVGANKGQFSAVVRHLFPAARIYAFEPLASERQRYEQAIGAAATVFPVAVSDAEGPQRFYVTNRRDSSSLLSPETSVSTAYQVEAVETAQVDVARIQDLVDLDALPRPVLMKIDVQGAELAVLRSLGEKLKDIDWVYCEVSFVSLYSGQPRADEICAMLFEAGFSLRGVYNVSSTPAYDVTQADMLFERIAAR